MSPVAKRFLSRRAAAAKRHSRFDWEFISVRVHQFHFALHDVRTVLDCLDCYHVANLPDVTRTKSVVAVLVLKHRIK